MRRAKQFRPRWLTRGCRVAGLFLCLGTETACTETPYAFFQPGGDSSGGTGGATCPPGDCGGDSSGGGSRPTVGGSGSETGGALTGGTGSTVETGGAPSGGAEPGSGGLGGAPSLELGPNCESPKRDSIVERLEHAVSGLCLLPGTYALLLGDPSYEIELVECEESLDQSWTIKNLVDPDGLEGLEFRNEQVNLNLDVRFAATTDDTPIMLFPPRRFYNQRFLPIEGEEDTFKLAPLHALTKCVTEVDGSLVLLPCRAGLDEQSFRRLNCR